LCWQNLTQLPHSAEQNPAFSRDLHCQPFSFQQCVVQCLIIVTNIVNILLDINGIDRYI
jgi:hypothetical protein